MLLFEPHPELHNSRRLMLQLTAESWGHAEQGCSITGPQQGNAIWDNSISNDCMDLAVIASSKLQGRPEEHLCWPWPWNRPPLRQLPTCWACVDLAGQEAS